MLNYFTKKYAEIKCDYLRQNPRGKWDFIRKVGNGVLQMIGVAIIDPQFEACWYSYFGGAVFLNLVLSFAYTLWHSYQNDTLLQGILLIALFGLLVSVCMRENKSIQNTIHCFYFSTPK